MTDDHPGSNSIVAPDTAPADGDDEHNDTSHLDDTEWVVTLYDEDTGLPVTGTLGHHRFHIDWDTRTPTQRRRDRDTILARWHRETSSPPPPPDTRAA